jgi:hypothetical protein
MANKIKHDRDLLVDKIMNMRIKGASTKTILDFLQDEIGYGQTAAYGIFKDAQMRIKEMYNEDSHAAFEEAVSRLERLYEKALTTKEKLEIEKELNKLKGLYRPQKLDITTDGKAITDINISIIYGDVSQDIEDQL